MKTKLGLILPFALLVGACAHVSVSDSSRTSNPAFDGYWEGEVSGTRRHQDLAKWSLECGAVTFTLQASIEKGRISAFVKENENVAFETNLNDNGKFYIAIPKKNRSYVSKPGGGSGYNVPSDEFHVFRGQLNPESQSGSGRYVLARNDMNMEGCTTPIEFNRLD